jgi:hypothetical protein
LSGNDIHPLENPRPDETEKKHRRRADADIASSIAALVAQLGENSLRLRLRRNFTGLPLIPTRGDVQDITGVHDFTGEISIEDEPQEVVLARRNIDEAEADSAVLFRSIADLRIELQRQFVAAERKDKGKIEHAARLDVERAVPQADSTDGNVDNGNLAPVIDASDGDPVSRMLSLDLSLVRDLRHYLRLQIDIMCIRG